MRARDHPFRATVLRCAARLDARRCPARPCRKAQTSYGACEGPRSHAAIFAAACDARWGRDGAFTEAMALSYYAAGKITSRPSDGLSASGWQETPTLHEMLNWGLLTTPTHCPDSDLSGSVRTRGFGNFDPNTLPHQSCPSGSVEGLLAGPSHPHRLGATLVAVLAAP